MNVETLLVENHGEHLKAVLSRLRIAKQTLADALGVHRTTLYKWFEMESIPLDVFEKIGKIIHYDFSVDIPELSYYKVVSTLAEPEAKYTTDLKEKFDLMSQDRDNWKTTAYHATDNLSRFKELFYQLAFEAKSKGIDVEEYMQKAKSIGSNQQHN